MEAGFYQVPAGRNVATARELLEENLLKGWRTLIRLPDGESLQKLDDWLWTHGEGSFLPHGTEATGFVEMQPVYLTADGGNPNGASCLMLLNGAIAPSDELAPFESVTVIFGADRAKPARALWQDWKEAGVALAYWQRDPHGSWQRQPARKHAQESNEAKETGDGD